MGAHNRPMSKPKCVQLAPMWRPGIDPVPTKALYRVAAWRKPNEDGAARPAVLMHRQWDGSWSLDPLRQAECMRCYPACGLEVGHPRATRSAYRVELGPVVQRWWFQS